MAIVDALAGVNASVEVHRAAYASMAAILGLLSVIPIYVTFATTRENPAYQELPAPGLRDSFRLRPVTRRS
ncbi:MAG: hypothetical protein U0559_00475 [Anaerolineae bacterium]